MHGADIFHPDFRDRPLWWDDFAPEDGPSAEPPGHADVVIVGAGYAGLSTALELAAHGTRVVVLEAKALGHGASTRNGGQVTGGTSFGKGVGGAAGAADADPDALLREGEQSMDFTEALIAKLGNPCAYERTGRLVCAWTPTSYRAMAAKVRDFNARGRIGAALLPRERQREEIGSDFYFGGMTLEWAGQLHPALYFKMLLDAARAAGALVCGQSPVATVARRAGGHAVTLVDGRIVQAGEIVIATNGYTGSATPTLRRRTVPIASHVIATEPLSEAQARELVPNNRTLIDNRRVLNYFRLSPDRRRLVFGGRPRFTDVPVRISSRLLYEQMLERFPQLAGTRITHGWNGNVAFSFDAMPHIGRAVDGLHYVLCCNGSGVTTMPYLGYRMARSLLAPDAARSAFDGRDFPTRPLYDGRPWFLPLAGGWFRARDALERVAALRKSR